jgi:hypothetical protein
MDLTYYRVGPPDSPDLQDLGLREILIEVCNGEVSQEIGIGPSGIPIYRYPSRRNKDSFRGLFDGQVVTDLIGEPINYQYFLRQWNTAAELEAKESLKTKI